MKLTDEDRAAFLKAVREQGVDPVRQCPVCRSAKVTKSVGASYCYLHFDFNNNLSKLHCRSCQRVWTVRHQPNCCAAAEVNENAQAVLP